MLYLSFKCMRKFKFCVSPLVKRYPSWPLCGYIKSKCSVCLEQQHQPI